MRLQAVESGSAQELIAVACEIKVAARRGLTLVDVYGSYGKLLKVMTMLLRKQSNAKFDQVIDRLKSLMPPPHVEPAEPANVSKEAPKRIFCSSNNSGALARSSVPILPYTSQLTLSPGPLMGTILREAKHDRVHCVSYVPLAALSAASVCIWWSAGG